MFFKNKLKPQDFLFFLIFVFKYLDTHMCTILVFVNVNVCVPPLPSH